MQTNPIVMTGNSILSSDSINAVEIAAHQIVAQENHHVYANSIEKPRDDFYTDSGELLYWWKVWVCDVTPDKYYHFDFYLPARNLQDAMKEANFLCLLADWRLDGVMLDPAPENRDQELTRIKWVR